MVQKVNFNNLTGDTLSVGNTTITGTGVTVGGAPLTGGSGGATQYANTASLPKTDLTFGEFALIGNTLFITNGTGWYSVGLINQSPSLSISVSDISLGSTGNTIDFTYTATDPDGPEPTVTMTTTANTSQANVTLYTSNSTVTVENLSATDYSANITLTATDGIDQTFGTVTLTVAFLTELWEENVLSIGTNSTNGLDNSAFIDRSTNAHTVTPSGSPIQTAFHPYLDNWSIYFDGGDTGVSFGSHAFGSGDWTIEGWINPSTVASATVSDCRPNGLNGNYPIVSIDGGGKFIFNVNSVNRIITTTVLSTGQWYHFAVVKNSGTTTFYVNGTAEGTWSDSTTYNSGLVRLADGAFSGSLEYHGYISNYRVVIGTAVYTSDFTPSTEKLTSVDNTLILSAQSNRFVDNSSNSYTITVKGNPEVSAFNPFGQGSEYAVGENKGSFRLESGDWVQSPSTSQASLSYAQDWTIEFWAYMDNDMTSVAQMLFNSVEGTGNWYPYIGSVIRAGGILQTQAIGGEHNTTGTVNRNEWFHVALVHDYSANELKTYLNGTLVQTLSKTYTFTTGAIRFNSYTINTASNYPTLGGYLSDFKWTIGSTVYTSNFTPPTAPVGNTNAGLYFPFDNSGIFDKTGNHTLTLVGDTSTSTTQTKFADTAMYFDGSGDYITEEASTSYGYGTSDFTIEFWMYLVGTSTRTVFSNLSSASGTQPHLYTNGTDLRFYTAGGDRIASGSLNANQWYHVSLCKGSSNTRLFIDGTQVGSTYADTNNYGSSAPLGIGTYHNPTPVTTQTMSGYIENLQVLKGVAKYTANFTPPTQTQGRNYQAES